MIHYNLYWQVCLCVIRRKFYVNIEDFKTENYCNIMLAGLNLKCRERYLVLVTDVSRPVM